MIIDTLEHLEKYASLNEVFPKIVAFIKENNLTQLEPAVYPIEGTDAYINIQVAAGKTKEEAVLESHRQMIDIQIPLEEDETFGYETLNQLKEMPYDAEKDIIFYPRQEAGNYLECKKGMFVVFFPQDTHAPCISNKKNFKKAIVKCPV